MEVYNMSQNLPIIKVHLDILKGRILFQVSAPRDVSAGNPKPSHDAVIFLLNLAAIGHKKGNSFDVLL